MIRYRARWVVPVASAPLDGGIVAVEGGRIAYAGPPAGAPRGVDVDLGDVVLMPGLVNAHCHLELTAMRGFLEDLDFRSWILRLTTSKRAVLGRDALLDAARFGVAEGLRAGITTYADTCDSGVAFDAMLEAGVRGVMYQEVFGPDPAQCERAFAELAAKVDALRPRETALVRVGISPHAPYTVSDDLFRAAAALARERALPMAVHIAESELETRLVVHADGEFAEGLRTRAIGVAPRARSPIALLAGLGVLDARPLLVHCVRIDDRDVSAIATARCGVAHCPASNAKLGNGIAPLLELLDAGVAVGLGSDSVASNNRMDLLEEARLAVLFQRARRGTHAGLSARQALALATIGGARALGLEHRVGTLEPGKDADLTAIPIAGSAPATDPEVAAVFGLTTRRASFVAVAGEPLVVDGVVLREDPALEARVHATGQTLARWLADGASAPPGSGARSPFTATR